MLQKFYVKYACVCIGIFWVGTSLLFCQQADTLFYTQEMEKLIGIEFTEEERQLFQQSLRFQQEAYQALHDHPLSNSIPPAITFNPIPVGATFESQQYPIDWQLPADVSLPDSEEDLAFYTVAQLSVLIRERKISSVELTKLYLKRLRQWGDTLHCVVTLMEGLALHQARKADAEIEQGNYRGPLHGIPYGVKDLLAVKDYPTTWGAMPYKDQRIQQTATVVKKLEAAGAVLLCKLSMGALARGDVWFKAKTRNPWNLDQGSSGSSAGSGAATAAGLVAFSIGTETLGSIVSPSTRCGVSGLRPTYGRVSRTGAMTLCWSMDKIGPMCRTAEDCALVFEVIRGTDGKDQTLRDLPFNYQPNIDLKSLKVGYFPSLFKRNYSNRAQDSVSLEVLQQLGAQLIPAELPEGLPIGAMRIILTAESSAAFDELTRSNQDSLLVRQIANAWPNSFRSGRFIPAVEYIQANRVRYQLIQRMHEMMLQYDVIITPSFGGPQLLMTNLTGHPCVVVPNGFNDTGSPTSISFIGNLYDEATLLAVAKAYQHATDFDEAHPQKFH